VLLVFDKFKDTLSSRALTSLVSEALLSNFPGIQVRPLPISDGGDGFVDCMHTTLKSNGSVTRKIIEVWDPLREHKCQAEYLVQGDTAYMEVANSAGLQLVQKERRDPGEATSVGAGEVIRRCYFEEGVKRIVIGSGGSAFVDGGIFAMTQGLGGFKVMSNEGTEIDML
jgi:glycerate 2-kinase